MRHFFNFRHGWASVRIGGFIGAASYVRDVPIEILESFKCFLETGQAPVFYIDEEGSCFTVVVEEFQVFVVATRKEHKLYVYEIDRDAFLLEIVEDMRAYPEDWKTLIFDADEDNSESLDRFFKLRDIVYDALIKKQKK